MSKLVAVGTLFAAISVAAAAKPQNDRRPSSSAIDSPASLVEEIIAARDDADYDRAIQRIAIGLQQYPNDRRMQRLSDEFSKEIRPILRLRYLTNRAPPEHVADLGGSLALTAEDEYYFSLSLPRECYVYVFFVDSIGEWTALVPNGRFLSATNPLPAGEYRIPDVARGKLQARPFPGAEKLYAVATLWKHWAFEDFSARLAVADRTPDQKKSAADLFKRLRLEEPFADRIPGFAFGSLELHNESALKNVRP